MPMKMRVPVTATALLLCVASYALAQPTAVSPFPRGLTGTLAFQSDVRTASNPNSRVKIYTIELATGAITPLTREGDWSDEQPRWSPDGKTIAFKSNRSGSYNLYVMDADGKN